MPNIRLSFKSTMTNVPKEISEYMKALQKKSAIKRRQNDPNTYKKMRAVRTNAQTQ